MKKNFTLAGLSILIISMISHAQVNYSFSAATATYVPVSGGTTPTFINRPYAQDQTGSPYATGIANKIPIGFTFNYNGFDYTTINISCNGFATLGWPFGENTSLLQNFYINSMKYGPLQNLNGSTA